MAVISKNKPRRERFIRYAPLFLWIAVIFFLSSTLGAMSHTSRIIRPLLEWLFPAASPETITLYHAYVRKFAHFTEYAILGFLAWRAFKGRNPRESRGVPGNATNTLPDGRVSAFLERYRYAAALGLVVLVASIDELNQSFNSVRTGSVYDSLLDISGGAAALLFLWLLQRNS